MTTQRTFTAEEAQKKFESLPQESKNFLYSAEMSSIIQKIGEKNKLHYDQMGRLENETTNVMLGFTDMEDYAPILAKVLEVDELKANAIVQDVNEMLFAKIRGAMKGADEQKKEAHEVSVVMPSHAATEVAPTPVAPPAPPVAAPPAASFSGVTVMPTAPPAASAPAPDLHKVDTMMSETTVSVAPKPATIPAPTAPVAPPPAPKVEAPKPAPYKADPYREPPE